MQHFLSELIKTGKYPVPTGLPIKEFKLFYSSVSDNDSLFLRTQIRDELYSSLLKDTTLTQKLAETLKNPPLWGDRQERLCDFIWFLASLISTTTEYGKELSAPDLKNINNLCTYFDFIQSRAKVAATWRSHARKITETFLLESFLGKDLIQKISGDFITLAADTRQEVDAKWKDYVKTYMNMIMDGKIDRDFFLKVCGELFDDSFKRL